MTCSLSTLPSFPLEFLVHLVFSLILKPYNHYLVLQNSTLTSLNTSPHSYSTESWTLPSPVPSSSFIAQKSTLATVQGGREEMETEEEEEGGKCWIAFYYTIDSVPLSVSWCGCVLLLLGISVWNLPLFNSKQRHGGCQAFCVMTMLLGEATGRMWRLTACVCIYVCLRAVRFLHVAVSKPLSLPWYEIQFHPNSIPVCVSVLFSRGCELLPYCCLQVYVIREYMSQCRTIHNSDSEKESNSEDW